MEIGVGRLPVTSVEEAQTTVDKIIRYMRNEQPGKWKNQLVYLADDGEGGTHTETSEISAEMIRLANPDFVVHKIFLDAYRRVGPQPFKDALYGDKTAAAA